MIHAHTCAIDGQLLNREPLIASDFNVKKQRHMHRKPVADAYKKKPNSFADLYICSSLLFSQDILLNPKSGVKIFRYTTMPQAKLENYKNKLKKITSGIFNHWLQTLSKKSIAENTSSLVNASGIS